MVSLVWPALEYCTCLLLGALPRWTPQCYFVLSVRVNALVLYFMLKSVAYVCLLEKLSDMYCSDLLHADVLVGFRWLILLLPPLTALGSVGGVVDCCWGGP